MSLEKYTKVESMITKLYGVISSKIICEEEELKEIHVLTNKSRSPKQISRDIQSLYAATQGQVLNHKIISIAQIEDGHTSSSCGRVVLEKISFENTFESDAEILVSTSLDGKIESGIRSGVASKRNLSRMIVEATVDSVEKLLHTDNKIVFEDCEHIIIAKDDVLVVAVSLINKSGEDLLIGTAVNKGNEREAIVRATLDALNRRIGRN